MQGHIRLNIQDRVPFLQFFFCPSCSGRRLKLKNIVPVPVSDRINSAIFFRIQRAVVRLHNQAFMDVGILRRSALCRILIIFARHLNQFWLKLLIWEPRDRIRVRNESTAKNNEKQSGKEQTAHHKKESAFPSLNHHVWNQFSPFCHFLIRVFCINMIAESERHFQENSIPNLSIELVFSMF